MHKVYFRWGGKLIALPRLLAIFKGPTSKGKEGEGKEGGKERARPPNILS